MINTIKKLAFLISFVLASQVNAQVVINEYSCSNLNGYIGNFGENEDWVELYNPTVAPIDLAGFYLSDKASNLLKWQIPSGSIPANGFKMAVASRKNTVNGNELHPNFNLKHTQGEWISLPNGFGNVVDSINIVVLNCCVELMVYRI